MAEIWKHVGKKSISKRKYHIRKENKHRFSLIRWRPPKAAFKRVYSRPLSHQLNSLAQLLVMVTSWARLVKVRVEPSRMFSSAVYAVQYTYNLE